MPFKAQAEISQKIEETLSKVQLKMPNGDIPHKEALADLKSLAQKVSDMSKDLAKKAVDNAEGVTDKVGDIVDSTGDALISAGETIKQTKKMFDKD